MKIDGEIVEIDESTIILKADDVINIAQVRKHRINGGLIASVIIQEKDSITREQQKHIYALIGDIAEYEGFPDEVIKSQEKYRFMLKESLEDWPSFKTNAMKKQQASRFIEMLIEYCIVNEIPFRRQQFYLTADTSRMIYLLTMHRQCVVCGAPHADVHHATNLIGIGNLRKEHDHWNSTYLALCRAHHTEVHALGLTEFCDRYYVKPVKLTRDELEQIRVM